MLYVLEGHTPVKCNNPLTWAALFKAKDTRIVARTKIGDKEVSTVFLGIDHQLGDGPPLLFESLVFPECEEMVRYSTWGEAEIGHKGVCELVRKNNQSDQN